MVRGLVFLAGVLLLSGRICGQDKPATTPFTAEMQAYWQAVDTAAVVEPELARAVDIHASYLKLSADLQQHLRELYGRCMAVLADTQYVSMQSRLRLGDYFVALEEGLYPQIQLEMVQADIKFLEEYLPGHPQDGAARDTLAERKQTLLQMRQGTWDE